MLLLQKEKKYLIFNCVCVCVCPCVCVWVCAHVADQRPEENIGFPGSGTPGA